MSSRKDIRDGADFEHSLSALVYSDVLTPWVDFISDIVNALTENNTAFG